MFACFCGCGRLIGPPALQPTKQTHEQAVNTYKSGPHRGPTPSGRERD